MTDDKFKVALEIRIAVWFDDAKRVAPSSEAQLLLHRISTLILRGGKRIRPELLFRTYVAYGGKNLKKLIDLGLALEFHHQFLLIHDDIIDNDVVRYDGPNIIGYYQQDTLQLKQNVSQAMGLLAGDLLFSFACQAIIEHKDIEDSQKLKLLGILQSTNIGVQYGQQLDAYNVDISPLSFTEGRMLLTHSLKAALYSAQLPMQSACVLLNLTDSEREKIDAFAKPFGVLFQLVDDYSDYFHNPSAFKNRPKYRDFRQGKLTYPLYIALTTAGSKDVRFLKKYLGHKDLPESIMSSVVSILKDCGAQEMSREYLEQFFIQATKALNQLAISSESKRQFAEMVAKYRV